jgi:hypothetical protein
MPKKCIKCECPNLINQTSIDKKLCENCYNLNPWPLEPYQESVLEDRIGERVVSEESGRNEVKESRIAKAARKYARYKDKGEFTESIKGRKSGV